MIVIYSDKLFLTKLIQRLCILYKSYKNSTINSKKVNRPIILLSSNIFIVVFFL